MKVNGMSIADFTALPVSRAVEAAAQIKLNPSARRRSPDAFCKEIAERLGFLNAVGLGYISLDRSAATLERRRRPAHPAGNADRLEAARRAVRAG